MNLLDTYISEIGRRLSSKNRADIEAEIRSALQDMLDERSKQAGKPVDDEMVLETLKAYGSPDRVAASYQGERYLIGPRLYPTFEKVVFIVLPITVVLALVGLAFSLTGQHTTANDVFELIFMTIGNMIGAVITTIGIIAVIFAILERTVPEFKGEPEKKEWDPRSLLKISPPDRVKPVELIVEIFFTGLAIVIFNFFPHLINIGYYSDGAWWVGIISTSTGQAWETSLLSEAFFRYLPALNVVWGATIVLNVLLVQRGRWEVWSRWSTVGLKALTIGIAVAMLAGPSLIGVTAQSLIEAGFPSNFETTGSLVALLNQIVRVALALTIIFGGLDLVRALVRLYGKKTPAPAAG